MLLNVLFLLLGSINSAVQLSKEQSKDLATKWYQRTLEGLEQNGINSNDTKGIINNKIAGTHSSAKFMASVAKALKAKLQVYNTPEKPYTFLILEPGMLSKIKEDPRQPEGDTIYGTRNKYHMASRYYAQLSKGEPISPYVWGNINDTPSLCYYSKGMLSGKVLQFVDHNRIVGALEAGTPIAVAVFDGYMSFNSMK